MQVKQAIVNHYQMTKQKLTLQMATFCHFKFCQNIFKKSLQAKKEVATQACTNDDNSMSGGSVTIVVDSTEAVIYMLKKNSYV